MRGFALGCAVTVAVVVVSRSFAEETDEPAPAAGSRVTTLYRHDSLRSSISLATGASGHFVEDHYVRNRNSDLDFGRYNADAFTIGIETGRKGVLIDLGSTEDVAKRFGFVEPVEGGEGYTSIHFEGGALLITRDVEKTFQKIPEAKQLVGATTAGASVPVVVGHIYLARLVDAREPAFERIAKILVVSHIPGESVTIRWDLLPR